MSRSMRRKDAPVMASEPLADEFVRTRQLMQSLAEPLSDADATIQSMEDASPAKWHLAHTTWFWETFVLREYAHDYRRHDERWAFLFNSYYEAEGARIDRGCRGMLSRPSLEEVKDWRAAVDCAMAVLLADTSVADEIENIVRLGIAHEQQHIELLLTDIKHALFQNPLAPAMWRDKDTRSERDGVSGGDRGGAGTGWYEHPGGIALIGHADGESDFAFDNEGPRHRVLIEPFALADRLITNGDWDEFIADGGYGTPSLWLCDGLAWVREHSIGAPLYWRDDDQFTHAGWQQRDDDAPVCHISFYEADAFARWAGMRLPTEFEWEAVARGQDGEQTPPAHDSSSGNQLDHAAPPLPIGGADLFGDCWQFTRSGYLPYPRFKPAPGAVGEYNGKFMSGQFVLKGASCASVRGHSRASYRNFFYPHQRWQFTGLRLAKDL